MKKNKTETKNYINLLKVIAMLMVVAMHVISKAMPNYPIDTFMYKFMLFIDILLRASVPIFILISGYLLLNKKYKLIDIIYRLLKYYIFFIIFNSLYMLLDMSVLNNNPITTDGIKNILISSLTLKSIYQMWYFQLILLTYASVPIFQLLIGKNSKLLDTITLVVLILLFQLIPWFIPTFYNNYTYYLVFLTYFFLGYYLKKYELKYMNILLFVLFIIGYAFTYIKSVNLDHSYYYFNFTFFNTMFVALFIYNVFSKFESILKNEKVNATIKYLSSYNFSIFIFHGLVIGLLTKLNVINIYEYSNVFMILVNTILVYLFTLVISIGLKKLFKEI
ncbi:MAG: acyltransferase family protein [Bacilli bacterium]|nr:acyltransferase family protein [Bacilli bacterium]